MGYLPVSGSRTLCKPKERSIALVKINVEFKGNIRFEIPRTKKKLVKKLSVCCCRSVDPKVAHKLPD